MAYTITTTAGATLASIADGTVNSTNTSLTLIGKNYAGYGIFLNENYVKLLENFNNSTAPANPLTGQLWYDSATSLLKVYSGSQWKPISSSASGSTQPSSPVIGDLWYDSGNSQLKVWSGSAWITVGPSYTTTSGTSGAVVETILDNGSTPHVVVKFYISNTVVAILSKDPSFVPGTGISGFSSIVPGLNLATSITGAQFTGTVSSAATLAGITASQFLRSDQATSSSYAVTVGSLLVGSDLAVTSSSGDVSIRNSTNNKNLTLYVNKNSTDTPAIAITGSTGVVAFANAITVGSTTTVSGKILPNADNTIDIGASGTKFANIFATTVNAVASTALYADLAERFEADDIYEPGTVVELGGMKEITRAVTELSESVFGVISTAAAYLMNSNAGSDKTHPAVAVQGRVPVKVIGKVGKGDRLVSAGYGLARAATRDEITAFNVIGRSLQDKNSTDEGTVEAIVNINS